MSNNEKFEDQLDKVSGGGAGKKGMYAKARSGEKLPESKLQQTAAFADDPSVQDQARATAEAIRRAKEAADDINYPKDPN